MTAVGILPAQEKLIKLRGELATLEATRTKEDVQELVEGWVETQRARYAGSARFILGGPEQVAAVFAEDTFDDAGLAGRLVARLEAEGFGQLSNRQRDGQRKKIEAAIPGLGRFGVRGRRVTVVYPHPQETSSGAGTWPRCRRCKAIVQHGSEGGPLPRRSAGRGHRRRLLRTREARPRDGLLRRRPRSAPGR